MIPKLRSLLPEPGGVISFVGAGGKTSCIYRLAQLLVEEGKRVLVTTTTRMYHPRIDCQADYALRVGTIRDMIGDFRDNPGKVSIAVQAEDREGSKVLGYSPLEVDNLFAAGFYDYILVEADGAKQKSIKAPADHEPSIPGCSSMAIGLVGLDSLGRPLDSDWVHRPEILACISGQEIGSAIRAETICSLVFSSRGLFKSVPRSCRKIVVLNDRNTTSPSARGKAIALAILRETRHEYDIEAVLTGSLL